MNFKFKTRELAELYSKGKGKEKYPPKAFKAFLRRVELIRAAKDERDLRAFKGIHFEKLRRAPGIYSMRLDMQYRLEIAFDRNHSGAVTVVILEISKHYGD